MSLFVSEKNWKYNDDTLKYMNKHLENFLDLASEVEIRTV